MLPIHAISRHVLLLSFMILAFSLYASLFYVHIYLLMKKKILWPLTYRKICWERSWVLNLSRTKREKIIYSVFIDDSSILAWMRHYLHLVVDINSFHFFTTLSWTQTQLHRAKYGLDKKFPKRRQKSTKTVSCFLHTVSRQVYFPLYL